MSTASTVKHPRGITVFWTCVLLDVAQSERTRSALSDLDAWLKNGTGPRNVDFIELTGVWASKIADLESDGDDVVEALRFVLLDVAEAHGTSIDAARLLVICEENSNVRNELDPTGDNWGAARGINVAAVWTIGEPHVTWHETLHLLGAKDCYHDSADGVSCPRNDNCLMQYVPTCESVGPFPVLCEKVRAALVNRGSE